MEMNTKMLLDEYLMECEYKKLSKKTITNYKRILEHFINTTKATDVKQLNKLLVKNYINNLQLSVSSKNQYIRTISAFINWIQDEYDVDLHIKLKRLKEQRTIKYTPTDDEVEELLRAYDNKSFMNCRNKTIISCFVNLGLRAEELLNLRKDDVDLKNGIITVRKRKGNIDQQLPINNELKLQLHKYMTRYPLDSEFLFVSRSLNKLEVSHLHYLLKKVNPKINPHSLRRACCTRMLKAGIPLIMVSRYMNHSSIEVTNSYYADIKATENQINENKNEPTDNVINNNTLLLPDVT